ncbi:pyridoxal phosphate-dependent aminotransferase family protein [Ulvibacterium sp.]|uniref:aminotransferase class I/II-fold pyridoxal phosphate-dependent enzyme n=1 Tax=Ulvibacterium sp. TaxID=2665914 RepID=UPI00262220F6|nr:pyridoxal phosphate-dependent aminotransferase family protein [Ulvibacterium sp.]
MAKLPLKLKAKLSKRKEDNFIRNLVEPLDLMDFTSNDYLGFARSKTIFSNAFKLLKKRGITSNGATGSRLLSGNHSLYKELEETLAESLGVPSALVFGSGYAANVGFFGSVPQRGDFVFFDELIHASIRDGIKMGNAKSYKFKHNDLEDLKDRCLSKCNGTTDEVEIYIVTESVFSMDGDSPDLRKLSNFCVQNGFNLIVDEAHAIGVFGEMGKGKVVELGLQKEVFASIITFGKALGCHGAAILGSGELKDYLVNFARSFIYTTALPPHSIATIIEAYHYLMSSKGVDSRERLKENIIYFKSRVNLKGLDSFFIPSYSAIQSCILPGNRQVGSIAKNIQDVGFDVKPIFSPTVPKGKERLRFCLHSFNTKKEIEKSLEILSYNLNVYG